MKKLESILEVAQSLHTKSKVEAFASEIEITNDGNNRSLSFTMKYNINVYFHDCSNDLRIITAHLVRWVRKFEKNKPAGVILKADYFAVDTKTFEYAFEIAVTEDIKVTDDNGNLIIDACEIQS